MFHSLMKMYHDGIILTENDQLVFHNAQIINIFDQSLNKQHQQVEEKQGLIVNKNFFKKDNDKIIEALKNTIPEIEDIKKEYINETNPRDLNSNNFGQDLEKQN